MNAFIRILLGYVKTCRKSFINFTEMSKLDTRAWMELWLIAEALDFV